MVLHRAEYQLRVDVFNDTTGQVAFNRTLLNVLVEMFRGGLCKNHRLCRCIKLRSASSTHHLHDGGAKVLGITITFSVELRALDDD